MAPRLIISDCITLPAATDVFVIGGGPAGLAAAIAARRRGFDVIVADSAFPPIDKACGEGLMPDGLRAARSLGIDLETAPARRFPGIRFCDGESSAEARFPSGHGLGMRRTTLHRYMVDVAADAGVRLAWGTTVSGIGGETVSAAGREIRARWIVGADGGHSRVRRWAGLDSCYRESCRFGFRAHYRIEPWSELMELHWGDGCQLYITPTADDEICVALLSRDPHLRLAAALPRFPAVARRLAHLEALRPTAELGAFPPRAGCNRCGAAAWPWWETPRARWMRSPAKASACCFNSRRRWPRRWPRATSLPTRMRTGASAGNRS